MCFGVKITEHAHLAPTCGPNDVQCMCEAKNFKAAFENCSRDHCVRRTLTGVSVALGADPARREARRRRPSPHSTAFARVPRKWSAAPRSVLFSRDNWRSGTLCAFLPWRRGSCRRYATTRGGNCNSHFASFYLLPSTMLPACYKYPPTALLLNSRGNLLDSRTAFSQWLRLMGAAHMRCI